jgi:glutaminase
MLEPGSKTLRVRDLIRTIESSGLRGDDPRLAGIFERLRRVADDRETLEPDTFCDAVREGILIVERALRGRLVIPDFPAVVEELQDIFEQTRENAQGAVADYIPQLARVNPNRFGAAVCTVDGQRASFGDAGELFCLQSACKPVSYCIALEEHGEEFVHRHIGCEPSGRSFNELTLNTRGLPHNPMINAGAIMSSALIKPGAALADRFEHVINVWRDLSGGVAPGFNNPVYLSERQTADRNFALGYFMREKRAFPEGVDLAEVLEFYFQCCSLEITAERGAVIAATLASGGLCPLTGDRIFRPDTVQKCLSLMYSCGMYDFSGEWAFRIGLPAKSGVSGVILTIVPNVMGLCTWSPRLDVNGNSVRGISFCRRLVETYTFHNYDALVGGAHGKKDPRLRQSEAQRDLTVDLCWAAAEGDLRGVRALAASGANLSAADYDGRTALHLASAEGRRSVVEYLLDRGVDPAPIDRWGGTPLDDAERGRHSGVVRLLTERMSGTMLSGE